MEARSQQLPTLDGRHSIPRSTQSLGVRQVSRPANACPRRPEGLSRKVAPLAPLTPYLEVALSERLLGFGRLKLCEQPLGTFQFLRERRELPCVIGVRFGFEVDRQLPERFNRRGLDQLGVEARLARAHAAGMGACTPVDPLPARC